MIPSDRNWLVEVERPKSGQALGATDLGLYEISPDSGELLTQFEVDARSKSQTSMQSDVSCWFNDEFTAIRNDSGVVTLVIGKAEFQKYQPRNPQPFPNTRYGAIEKQH
jgi:hypothetical protein